MKFLVNRLFSESVRENAPEMIQFLEKFFDWMSKDNNGIAIIEKLSTNQDLTLSESNYISTIADIIANDFPISISNNLKLLLKHVLQIYKAKSSIECLKYLFDAFYGVDIEIKRPWDDVMKLNTSTFSTSSIMYISSTKDTKNSPIINNVQLLSGKYFTVNHHDYKSEDLVGWMLIGEESTVQAEIISINKSANNDYAVTFNNVNGTFIKGEPIKLLNVFNGDIIQNNVYNNTQLYVYEYKEYSISNEYENRDGVIVPVKGNWSSELGKLDSSIVLQDSKWYQEFSYTIESDISYTKWQPIVKLLLHPAGFNIRGNLKSSIDNHIMYYNRSYLLDPNNPNIYYNLLGTDKILEKERYTPDTVLGRTNLSNYMLKTCPTTSNYGLDITLNDLIYPQFVEKDKYVQKYFDSDFEENVLYINGAAQYNHWFNDFTIKDVVDNSYHWNKSFYNPENYDKKYDKAAYEFAKIQYGYYDENGKWVEGIYDFDKYYKEYRIFYSITEKEQDDAPATILTDNSIVQDKSRQLEYELKNNAIYNSSTETKYVSLHNAEEYDAYMYLINNSSEFINVDGKYYKHEPGTVELDITSYAGLEYIISGYYNISNVECTYADISKATTEYKVYCSPDPDSIILKFDYEYKYYRYINDEILEKLKNLSKDDVVWLSDENKAIKNNNYNYLPVLSKDFTPITDKPNKEAILVFNDSTLYNLDLFDYEKYKFDFELPNNPVSVKGITLVIENNTVCTKIKGVSITLPEEQFSDKNVMIFTGGLYNSSYKKIRNLTVDTYIKAYPNGGAGDFSTIAIKECTKDTIINKIFKTYIAFKESSNDTAIEISTTISSTQLTENQLIKIPENEITIDKENHQYIFDTGTNYVEEENVVIYNYKDNLFSGRMFLERVNNTVQVTYDSFDHSTIDTNQKFIENDYIQLQNSYRENYKYIQNYITLNTKVNDISVYLDRIIENKNQLLVFYNGLLTTTYKINIETNNLGQKVTKISDIKYAQQSTNKITYEFMSYKLSEVTLDTEITKDGQKYLFSSINLSSMLDASIISNGSYTASISTVNYSKYYLNRNLLNIFNALQTNPDLELEIYITSPSYNHTLNTYFINSLAKEFTNYDVYTNKNTIDYGTIKTFRTHRCDTYDIASEPNIKVFTDRNNYIDNEELIKETSFTKFYSKDKDDTDVLLHYNVNSFNTIDNNFSVVSENTDNYKNIVVFGNNQELNFSNISFVNRSIANDIGFDNITVFPFKETEKKSLTNLFFTLNDKLYVHMSDYVSYFIDNKKLMSFDDSLIYTDNTTSTTLDTSKITFNNEFYNEIFEDKTTGLDKIIDETFILNEKGEKLPNAGYNYMVFLNGAKILEDDIKVQDNYYYMDAKNFENNYVQNILYKNINIDDIVPATDVCIKYKTPMSYYIMNVDDVCGDDYIYTSTRKYIKLDDLVPYENELVIGNNNNYLSNIYQYNKKYRKYYVSSTHTSDSKNPQPSAVTNDSKGTIYKNIKILLDIDSKDYDILAFVNGSYVKNPKIEKNISKKYIKSHTKKIYNISEGQLIQSIVLPEKNITDIKIYDPWTFTLYTNYTFENNTITLGELKTFYIVYTYTTIEYHTSVIINESYIIPDNYEISNLHIYYNESIELTTEDYKFENNTVRLVTKKYTNCYLEYDYTYNDDSTTFSDRFDNEESGYYIELSADAIHNYEIYVFDQPDFNIRQQFYYIGCQMITDNLYYYPDTYKNNIEYSNIIKHTSDDTTWYNTWS